MWWVFVAQAQVPCDPAVTADAVVAAFPDLLRGHARGSGSHRNTQVQATYGVTAEVVWVLVGAPVQSSAELLALPHVGRFAVGDLPGIWAATPIANDGLFDSFATLSVAGAPLEVRVLRTSDPEAAASVLRMVNVDEVARKYRSLCNAGSTHPAPGGLVPSHALGDPLILGTLDRSHVDAVIDAAKPQVHGCYRSALAASPALAGKVVVKFIVDKTGGVSSASIKSTTLVSKPVEDCLVDMFLGLTFDSPRGGGIVIVSYPFVFAP